MRYQFSCSLVYELVYFSHLEFSHIITTVFKMGYTCCVPNCKPGYRSNKESESEAQIPLSRFPSDPILCQQWIKTIPRENLNVKINRAEFVLSILLILTLKL